MSELVGVCEYPTVASTVGAGVTFILGVEFHSLHNHAMTGLCLQLAVVCCCVHYTYHH